MKKTSDYHKERQEPTDPMGRDRETWKRTESRSNEY